MNRSRTAGFALAALGLGAACLAMSACYEKVTRAEGFGTTEIQTEQGNLRQGPIDNALYGRPREGRSDPRPGVDRKRGG